MVSARVVCACLLYATMLQLYAAPLDRMPSKSRKVSGIRMPKFISNSAFFSLILPLAVSIASLSSAAAQLPTATALVGLPGPAIGASSAAAFNSAIDGRILDPQGLPVSGAIIQLLDGDLLVASTTTDAEGTFYLAGPAERLRIRVSVPGMAILEEDLQLVSEAPVRFDRKLEVAKVTDTVMVSASNYQIEEQIAATHVPIAPLDLPQTITTISQEVLRDRAVQSMQEALAYVPGASQILGEGRRDQVSLRGMNANTDQYIDGIRDDATYYRDLSNTDHIEVVEGPAAVLYGRGTSGGLVDRVTKKPRNEGMLAELTAVVGSYRSARIEGDVDTLLNSSRLGLRTTGAWEDSGSFRQMYSLSRYAYAPTMRWRPTPNQDLTFQFERLRDERVPDRGIPSQNGRPAPVEIANYYGYAIGGGVVPADYLHNGVSDETVDWRGKAWGWNGHEVLRHAGYQTVFQNTYPSGLIGTRVARGEYDGRTSQENYFNQAEAWRRFHTPGLDHLFLMGIEYGHQNIRRRQYTGTAASVDLFNPGQVAPVLSTSLNTNNSFLGQTAAGYLQDELSFARKWKALLGLRFDNYRQSQSDYKTPSNSAARADNAASPRIGLLYQPSSSTTYYVSWSHTFNPSGEALNLTAASSNNTARLNPERTDNYEIGAKRLLLDGRITATAALFRLERTDVKVPDYTADPSGTMYINAGTQRTDGFEFGASGSVNRHWYMSGGWAWMDAYFADNPALSNGVRLQGKRAQLIPVNSGSLWQMYEFSRGFGVGIGATAMNSRYAATDNLVRLPGYARIDATVYYRTHRWDLDAHVENLSNVHYYQSAQSDYQIMPGSPVIGRATLRVRF
jgi:catecholate siderophore receptor